ncbi:hypothetical protein MC63_014655 [Shigella flexneri]|nr:hypothetical protein MC63_014655 [Shigella flexneri]QBB80665.1 hypothetical protein D6T62_08980 [Shigella flexneri]
MSINIDGRDCCQTGQFSQDVADGALTMYQRLLKVDPLKCVLCGSQMRFTGLKRGYRLAEQVLMHEPLARMRWCG